MIFLSVLSHICWSCACYAGVSAASPWMLSRVWLLQLRWTLRTTQMTRLSTMLRCSSLFLSLGPSCCFSVSPIYLHIIHTNIGILYIHWVMWVYKFSISGLCVQLLFLPSRLLWRDSSPTKDEIRWIGSLSAAFRKSLSRERSSLLNRYILFNFISYVIKYLSNYWFRQFHSFNILFEILLPHTNLNICFLIYWDYKLTC